MILSKTFIEHSACMFIRKSDLKLYKGFGMLRLTNFTHCCSQDFLLYTDDTAITNIIKSYCFNYLGKCLC